MALQTNNKDIDKKSAFCSELFKPNGRFLKLGDLVQRTKYAKTLEKIAESEGSDIFYTGEMGKQVKILFFVPMVLNHFPVHSYNFLNGDN